MGRFVGLIVILFLLVFGGWFYWKFYYTYSDGNRTGLLQKFSHKGNLFKTYEGELVLASVLQNNTTSFSTEKFFFSVEDKSVAEKLMNYEGRRVVLHYQEKNGAPFWRGDSKYIVDSVREVTQ
jgi:hypothetical protein